MSGGIIATFCGSRVATGVSKNAVLIIVSSDRTTTRFIFAVCGGGIPELIYYATEDTLSVGDRTNIPGGFLK